VLGAIRRRDILAHPLVTIHSFGWPVFIRALMAGRRHTFLSILAQTRPFRPPESGSPEILGRCVELEQRAQRIYARLAQRFADRDAVRRFFETLSEQEAEHAELLQICRELGAREGWLEAHVARWSEAVPGLLEQMEEAERAVAELASVADALRLVLRLEGSEINRVFAGAVETTDSPFVRSLQAFHVAGARHLAYVREQIAEIEPALADACRELGADSA